MRFPQKEWSVQQDSAGTTPITPIASPSIQGQSGNTQGRGNLGGGLYSNPLGIIGSGNKIDKVQSTSDYYGGSLTPKQAGVPIYLAQELNQLNTWSN